MVFSRQLNSKTAFFYKKKNLEYGINEKSAVLIPFYLNIRKSYITVKFWQQLTVFYRKNSCFFEVIFHGKTFLYTTGHLR